MVYYGVGRVGPELTTVRGRHSLEFSIKQALALETQSWEEADNSTNAKAQCAGSALGPTDVCLTH